MHRMVLFLLGACVLGSSCYEDGRVPKAAKEPRQEKSNLQLRPEIKKYIDELYHFSILSVAHTTDSIPRPPERRTPSPPKPFDAGRFRVIFEKDAEVRALICQTESKVGHYARVVPGETDVGGHVQILDDPEVDSGPGATLTSDELDHYVQMLYRKFSVPLSEDEAALIDKTKNIALAIMFSKRQGIEGYHREQVDTHSK